MKTITIGRDTASNIFIDDPMISRHHALLRIYPIGKMELVDMSSNGTYVNRVRLASNVPFPLTRKDMVSFAGVKQLDWNLVPNPLAWVKWTLLGLCVVVLLVASAMLLRNCEGSEEDMLDIEQTEVDSGEKSISPKSAAADSTTNTKNDDSNKLGKNDNSTAKNSEKSVSSNPAKDKMKDTKDEMPWHEKEVQKAKREEAARKAGVKKGKKSQKDTSEKLEKKSENNNVVF